MTKHKAWIPSGSQTVGPFFQIGLEYLIDQEPVDRSTPAAVQLHGKVLDSDGVPVPDAMLEFWGAVASGAYVAAVGSSGKCSSGFHRVATDMEGNFSFVLEKPGPAQFDGGRLQAPHMMVLVFARGLLRHLVTRVYFEDESANADDPVLAHVPPERRHTLIARADVNKPQVFEWNVILQGNNETAFFAW